MHAGVCTAFFGVAACGDGVVARDLAGGLTEYSVPGRSLTCLVPSAAHSTRNTVAVDILHAVTATVARESRTEQKAPSRITQDDLEAAEARLCLDHLRGLYDESTYRRASAALTNLGLQRLGTRVVLKPELTQGPARPQIPTRPRQPKPRDLSAGTQSSVAPPGDGRQTQATDDEVSRPTGVFKGTIAGTPATLVIEADAVGALSVTAQFPGLPLEHLTRVSVERDSILAWRPQDDAWIRVRVRRSGGLVHLDGVYDEEGWLRPIVLTRLP